MPGKINHHYREGPHVFDQGNEYQILYCDYSRKEWKETWKYVDREDECVLEVSNPLKEPFKVRIRNKVNPSKAYFEPSDQILVISDIEGNFTSLISLLETQAVIDSERNWTFGNGHLVMLGDLLDRGADVTPCLWLLYKLEEEAQQAGGRVHILLGNHEIMVFEGDLRYLNKKYIHQGEDSGIQYKELFSSNTILGRWLRQQPSIIRIGNLLFSHAGISPEVYSLRLSIDSINHLIRAILVDQKNEYDNMEGLSNVSSLLGAKGIFWYRDWVESPQAENVVDSILQFYEAGHMIIGHTIVPEIQPIYGQKVIAIDLVQPRIPYFGESRALLYERGNFFEVSDRGKKKNIPL